VIGPILPAPRRFGPPPRFRNRRRRRDRL